MTINIGIYTKDFIQEDQYKAKTYECVNCNLVSEYNYCIDCNHCICTECLKKTKKCPLDNRIIDENTSFRFNYIGNNLLEALRVNCIYRNNGCPWIGTKKQLEEIHYHKCLYRDNRRKLIDMGNMNNFDIFGNNNINNVINNIEENNRKMMLRKKPKKRNIEYDEDLEEESSNSNFSKLYLGNDESSVVEVDNSDGEDIFAKDNFIKFSKKFNSNINNLNDKLIRLNNDDSNLLNFCKNNDNNNSNGLKIIRINAKNENNEFINRKTKKNFLEIQNDIKIAEIIKNSKKKMDEFKILSSDIYEINNNKEQKNLIKINDEKMIFKPKRDIIQLEEYNEFEKIIKNKDKSEKSVSNKVFVFK